MACGPCKRFSDCRGSNTGKPSDESRTYKILVEVTATNATPFDGDEGLARSRMGNRNTVFDSDVPLSVISGCLHHGVDRSVDATVSAPLTVASIFEGLVKLEFGKYRRLGCYSVASLAFLLQYPKATEWVGNLIGSQGWLT